MSIVSGVITFGIGPSTTKSIEHFITLGLDATGETPGSVRSASFTAMANISPAGSTSTSVDVAATLQTNVSPAGTATE